MDKCQHRAMINIYQWNGGGKIVFQFLPKFWQIGTVKFGGYRTVGIGPFNLAWRVKQDADDPSGREVRHGDV